MSQVTQILKSIEDGDLQAAEELLPLVYDELRKLAAAKLAREKPGQTLQATALVHEAYLRLVGPASVGDGLPAGPQRWENRRHFFAAAAEAMRRLLVDNARRKSRPRHGGDRVRVPIDDVQLGRDDAPDELLQIDEALERLAREDPPAAEIVKLCYFAGLEVEQAAEVLGLSRATAYRHWNYAKAWLHTETKRAE